jgi:hypothetical protein
MLAHFEPKGDRRRSARRSLRLGISAGADLEFQRSYGDKAFNMVAVFSKA